MQRKYFILLAMVVALSLSCQQELDVEPPLLYPPKILGIEPNPAKPGDVVTVTGQNFSARYWENVLWIGAQKIHVDSGATSKLFVRAPWGVSSGSLSVKTPIDSVGGPVILILPPCNLLSGAFICLGSYTGVPITDSSAWKRDFFGQLQKWSATISGDTITLVQDYLSGDESHSMNRLQFKHLGNNNLPLYLKGYWKYTDFPATNIEEPLKGYITIEQWKIPGILSGRVSTYVDYWHDWTDYNFYAVVR